MKINLIIAFFIIGIFNARSNSADVYGGGREFKNKSLITAVNRFYGDRTWLVLQKNNTDLLTIPNTPPGIVPKLEDAAMKDDQLAVVLDYEWSLLYQLYTWKGGVWSKNEEVRFYPLNINSRSRLILVQIINLTHVKLSMIKNRNLEARVKGVVKPDDLQDIFDFSGNGVVLKNGNFYNYSGE